LFSPQISPKSLSHSQNKATELKKREKRKRKVLKEKKRERKELQKSLMKRDEYFREEKNISTSSLLVWVNFLSSFPS
jgi:hypothetical protein